MEKNNTQSQATHYFYFLEHLLGIWNFGGEKNHLDVQLVILANDGNGTPQNWKGNNDLIYHLSKALFPNAEILDWSNFVHLTKRKVVRFEHVITSDRAMDDFKTEPYPTGRMLGGYFESLKIENQDNFASRIWSYCEVEQNPSNKLLVTYERRPISRRLSSKCENELIEKIKELPNVELLITDFSSMPFREQVNIISNTDTLLAVHGNGLSHTLLLPKKSTVIELFPKDSFRVEYRIFAKARELSYYGWMDSEGWINDKSAERGIFGEIFVEGLDTDVDAIVAILQNMNTTSE